MDKQDARQHEIALYEHYAWHPYWNNGFFSVGLCGVMLPAPLFDERILTEDQREKNYNDHNDVHLRSTERITGYHIHTTDGETGHVTDFVIDDETWQILYFLIDTHNWFGGKKVLIPVSDIMEINWEVSKVILNTTSYANKNSKLFNESEFMHIETKKL